jgi:hypothetical protein
LGEDIVKAFPVADLREIHLDYRHWPKVSRN